MKRRTVLQGLVSATVALPGPVPGAQAGGRRRLPLGAAVQARHILVDGGFRQAVSREVDLVVPELELKWDFVEDRRGEYYLKPADQIAAYARGARKRLHGHALLWHKGTPAWAIERMVKAPDWADISRFMATVLGRYRDVARSWDVVNEPIEPGSRPDGLRQSPFLSGFGPGYIGRAFTEAARLAPGIDLYLNEYGLLYDFPESAARRSALLGLLRKLVAERVPIHGVGIEAHLELAKMGSFDPGAFAALLDGIAGLGLRIRISELDVLEAETAIPTDQRDQRVAEAARRVLDVATASPALVDVTCWGLSDRYSWLPPESAAAGLNRGLPLDSDLRQKPMYRVLREKLNR